MIVLPSVSEIWQVTERIPSFKRAETQYVSSSVSLSVQTKKKAQDKVRVYPSHVPCPWPLLLSWVSEVLLITVIFTVMFLQQQWEGNHHLVSLELLHRCQAVAGFNHFRPGLCLN